MAGTFGLPSPDTLKADVLEVSKSTGVAIQFQRTLELPLGAVELYQVAGGPGVFAYLPRADTPLLSVATARRFVHESGAPMSEIERRVARERWRLGLDDPRRQALYELGAGVHQEWSELGLFEWIFLPWERPAEDLAATLEISAREPRADPEVLIEAVLEDWARDDKSLDLEEAGLEVGALVAGRARDARSARASDADALFLMGPVGRRAALEAATRWLQHGRPAAPDDEPVAAEPLAHLDVPAGAKRLRARFEVPKRAGRWVNGEMAVRWLSAVLGADVPEPKSKRARIEVESLRLERSTLSAPRLDVFVRLDGSVSSTRAPELLKARFGVVKTAALDRETRRALSDWAEQERQRQLESPYPLAFALLEALLENEAETFARPLVPPRPGAIKNWLEAVLVPDRASWSESPP